jgi:hypothetical protein
MMALRGEHHMSNMRRAIMATALMAGSTFQLMSAQQPAPAQGGGRQGAAPQPMTFFVTSVGKGDGANYGGLAGADAHCQALAAAAGRGDARWVAYLSTQGPNAVSARDRIGSGPWVNAKGQRIAASVAELHGDTLEQARLGNRIQKTTALNEKGELVNGVGDTPNQHDMLTGSTPDGRAFTDGADHTCSNYTSNANVPPPTAGQPAQPGPSVMLGHHDRLGGPNASWNAVHASSGCSQANLVATGGAGLLYCFAPGAAPAGRGAAVTAPPK